VNALVLLYVHKDIPIHVPSVVDRFAANHPRRMLLSDYTTETASVSDNSNAKETDQTTFKPLSLASLIT
jgi:hypothetical protein